MVGWFGWSWLWWWYGESIRLGRGVGKVVKLEEGGRGGGKSGGGGVPAVTGLFLL